MLSLESDNEQLIKAENLCTELFESIANIVGPEKGEELHRAVYGAVMNDIDSNPGIYALKRMMCGEESYSAAESMLESFLDNLCAYTGHYSGVHNQDNIEISNRDIRYYMDELSSEVSEIKSQIASSPEDIAQMLLDFSDI